MDLGLSTQALTALVGYVIVAVALFIPMKSDPNHPKPYNVGSRLLVLAVMLIPTTLSIYTINCLVQGECSVWSWINSILVFVWSLLILGVSVYGAFYDVHAADAAHEAAHALAPAPKK